MRDTSEIIPENDQCIEQSPQKTASGRILITTVLAAFIGQACAVTNTQAQTNVEISEIPQPEKSPKYIKRVEAILNLGFVQIEDSNQFKRGKFIIEIDKDGGYKMTMDKGKQLKNIDKYLTEDFKVISYEEIDGESIIRVSTEALEFSISSENGGYIYRGDGYCYDCTEHEPKILRELKTDDIKLKRVKVKTEKSGFKIGGVNSTEQIKKLTHLNGQSIDKLEKTMRPNPVWSKESSFAGFLGNNEDLKQVLANDNDYVLSQNLTHQDLVEPLRFTRELIDLSGYLRPYRFSYEGSEYEYELSLGGCCQWSPFKDGTKTNADIVITNLTNGETIKFSYLLPNMIERYGFYEGKGTSYRLEPKDIIEVFPHLIEKTKESK